MSSEAQEELAVTVALRNAMEGDFKILPHGCRLFKVEKGWESKFLAKGTEFLTADSLLSLENAISNEDYKVIFIPADALIADSDIEKICQRNAIVKTFFKEVS